MERQKAILCSNHLVLINVSQHELGVVIESRKCSVYSWSRQNRAGSLGNPGCKDGKGWFMLFRSIFSGSARVVVAVGMGMRLSLVVLEGDKDGLGCAKQVVREEFEMRCTKKVSDIYSFYKT